ncbi:LysR family transcriptional regulator [Vibrio hannami]|uniref:LysR family transcriptional regulator n=1 Tax=Vibrio hannami TaxID=2717094 RepID=UPI002410B650|nr:LysR family transcriptional regulator [Vibrio hannami]MDG3085561.1 LysR family transcriptional regulator [Vibrio hannami]
MIDYKSIDLNLLLSLNILLETKNVTRASEKLGVRQSTVSAQLSRLRKAFNDPLLIPSDTGRGMIVTKRAEEIFPEIKNVLKTVEQIVANKPSFNPKEDSRTYNITSSDNGVISIGLPLVETISKIVNPNIQVAFHNFSSEKIASQMERGEIDILIGSKRMVPETMKARKLYNERFVLLQRKNHPRGLRTLDIDEYCELQHVLVSIDGGGFYGCMDEHLEALGKKETLYCQLNSLP